MTSKNNMKNKTLVKNNYYNGEIIMKTVQPIFYLFIITLTSSTCGMHIKSKADYWNQPKYQGGNTNMHKIAGSLYVAQNNLDTYINKYKHAIKEGGNPLIPNEKNHTAAQFLESSFAFKFCEAIDNNNRPQIQQLISSAPELCSKAKHRKKGSLFRYARRNLYARAMISYYQRNGKLPQKNTEVLEAIVRYL